MAIKKKEEQISQDIRGRSSYTPLDTSGNDYADMVGMSDLDRAALDAAGQSWNDANERGYQAGRDAAHQQAESIRRKYNYSGGVDGSQYIPGEDFSYERAPEYVNQYQKQIDALMNSILNREAFTYDAEQDPLFQQYQKIYTREGQRAMQDTLGKVSARTGGLASSYAVNAAQGANDYYMQQLTDKIPELQKLAYEMYQNEGDTQRANLEMLLALEQGDYAKYADLLVQFNTDRDFGYGKFLNDRNFDYGLSRDQVEDARYTEERDYDRSAQKAQMMAAAGDFSGYKALGYSDMEIAALERAYRQDRTATNAGSVSSGNGSEQSKPRLTLPQTLQAIEDGVTSQQVLDAYEYYYGVPYESESDEKEKTTAPIEDYGTSYSSIWGRVRNMYDQGSTTDQIKAFLDQFSEEQLSDFGLEAILDSLNLYK